MLKFVTFCLVLTFALINGHSSKKSLGDENNDSPLPTLQDIRSDANMQSDLMPQELNTAFAGDASPSKLSFFANRRYRRDATVAEPTAIVEPESSGIAAQVKHYSRVISGIVLVISAVIEVVVYIIETYGGPNVA